MSRKSQRGYVSLPSLTPIVYLALIGILAVLGSAGWLIFMMIQHLHWI